MGGGHYSDSSYDSHTSLRSSRGYSVRATAHTDDVNAGRARRGVHQRLNPLGLRMREARDSTEHPESLPIAVFLDVTGSMSRLPMIAMQKLPALMGLLLTRGYAAHPQVLFGAVGDAMVDHAPLQVGQFESAIQMAEDLDAIFAEGGGGGGGEESYELAWYVAARHTALDSVEKRGKKGYLFTIGDEEPYDAVDAGQVRAVLGGGLQERLPIETVLAEARQKFHVFHLIAARGSNGSNLVMRRRWAQLLGDHAIVVDHMEFVAEIIALVVGLMEGAIDLDAGARHLAEVGVDRSVAEAICASVEAVAAGARRIHLPAEA